jgi:hypothetical protein
MHFVSFAFVIDLMARRQTVSERNKASEHPNKKTAHIFVIDREHEQSGSCNNASGL